MDRQWLEGELQQLPLVLYEFFPTDTLVFSDKVRQICRQECPMYNTSWACPPAVGEVEACPLPTRMPHEALTHQVLDLVRRDGTQAMALSTESCAICPRCAWPGGPCRHPDRMFPCVESHGILVTELAERFGMDFLAASNVVTWFSLILYRQPGEGGGG